MILGQLENTNTGSSRWCQKLWEHTSYFCKFHSSHSSSCITFFSCDDCRWPITYTLGFDILTHEPETSGNTSLSDSIRLNIIYSRRVGTEWICYDCFSAVQNQLLAYQHHLPFITSGAGRRCWFMQNCWSVVLIFVSLLCAEDPGIGMCRSSVRMWVIWELANTAAVSTGPRLWFKNHIQTDIIIQLHLTHWGLWIYHTHTHSHSCTQTVTHRSTFHPTQ